MSSRTVIRRIAGDWATGGSTSGSIGGGGAGGVTTNVEVITNSSDGVTNLEFRIYEFFNEYLLLFLFQMAKWEKNLLWTNKKFVFFSTDQTEKNPWTKLVNQIGENIWWIRYKWGIFPGISFLHAFKENTGRKFSNFCVYINTDEVATK